MIGSNHEWHDLSERLELPAVDGDCFIADVFRNCLDPGSQHRLELAGEQLTTSGLFVRGSRQAVSLRVSVTPLMDERASLAAAVWILRDVTFEQKSHSQQRHREKMQAISRLTAGIAHEFNNLLTAVLGNLEIMRAQAASEPTGHLDAAESAAVRATRLIQELRHFGTRSIPGLKPQSVGTVLQRSAQILQGMCQPGVNVACQIRNNRSLTASIDAEMLQDVMLRLGRNSMEAIAGTGGTIRLTSDLVRVRHSGYRVRIQVTDDGPGLESPADERAFEPFFTTRSPDSNSGLGLAIVYGLVEEMGGTVDLSSGRSGGTVVTILLPVAELPTPVEPPAVRRSPVRALRVGLVDNEPGVRSVGQGMLRLIGHDVTTFASGQELLEFLTADSLLDVILLDRAMPVISGRETYAQIRRRGCRTPVIICSGAAVDLASFGPEQESPPEGFLAKPFTQATLSAAIEQAVAQRQG